MADDPVPVTVMVEVPVGVVDEVVTVMVELCPALMVWGLNETRAPLGAPVALKATDWVEPLVTVVEMVGEVGDPAVTVAEGGLAVMEKSLGGAGFTVREKVVEWVADDPVPVTVMVEVPVGVEDEVVTVMVELCPALMVWGLNETRAPVGTPVALRATDWVEPLVTVVEIVGEVGDPAVTVAEVGLAVMEKSLGTGAFTVREKVVEWVADDPVPVSVIGKVPVGVVDEVVTVMVELCPALMVWGLNETRAPLGAPVALKATDWVAPLMTVVEMEGEVPDPAVTVAEVGLAAMEKSLDTGAFTVRVKVWVAGLPTPLLALMVMTEEETPPAVPARVAVPLPLSTKVTPLGSAPDSDRAA
ncbi:MAG TPA: hypothetical protein VG032_10380, partial [Acidimicrobiales bacterium]|nr:hypothetical protein [Acidimicrobiales bacterium]